MKKALVLASVASMIDQFNMPNIRLLQDLGYEVHVACNFINGSTCSDEKINLLQQKLRNWNVTYFQIDFARNIAKIKDNFKAYKQIKTVLSKDKYDLLHCHSPIGGFIGRLAAKPYRKKGLKVIYTAHGFHFYSGAPLKNWLIYYPVEKISSRWTDVLITINQEDYSLAQEKMRAKRVEYVPGVGIDLQKFSNATVDRVAKRRELGIPDDAFLLLSVGEVNENKNHETVIRAIANLDVYYLIAGRGNLQEHLRDVITGLGMTNRVKLLGFRSDVAELYKVADIFVFPSFREGLSVSVMEAMASGLPVVCSRIRGNTDLIDENGGALFNPYSVKSCTDCLNNLADLKMKGAYNQEKVNLFDISAVMRTMKKIYSE